MLWNLMISRRRLLSSTSSAVLVATAGCLGNADAGDDSSTAPTTSGEITDLRSERGVVTLTIEDSSNVEAINLIDETSEYVTSKSVATGSASVSFEFLERDRMVGGYRSEPTGEYRFVAVDSDDEEVGSATFVHRPVIELAAVSTGAVEFPTETESEMWLVLSVTNGGTSTGVFDGMQFSYLPEKDVNHVSGDTDRDPPRFVQTEGIADGKYGVGSLDTIDHMEKETIEEHLIEPGETKRFIKTVFFRSMENGVSTAGIESCDFERSFTLTLFSTPEPDAQTVHEVTVQLSGDVNVDSGFGATAYWCGTPEITSVEEVPNE